MYTLNLLTQMTIYYIYSAIRANINNKTRNTF